MNLLTFSVPDYADPEEVKAFWTGFTHGERHEARAYDHALPNAYSRGYWSGIALPAHAWLLVNHAIDDEPGDVTVTAWATRAAALDTIDPSDLEGFTLQPGERGQLTWWCETSTIELRLEPLG